MTYRVARAVVASDRPHARTWLPVVCLLAWSSTPASAQDMVVEEIAIAPPTTLTGGERFGTSMVIDDERLIVTFDGGFASYTVDAAGAELAEVVRCDAARQNCAGFGWSAGLAEDVVLVGSPFAGPTGDGVVSTYHATGPDVFSLVSVAAPMRTGVAHFGFDVDGGGGFVIVGGPYTTWMGGEGQAQLYRVDAAGNLSSSGDAFTTSAPHWFGWSVATDGDVAAVACMGERCATGVTGHIFVYAIQRTTGMLTQIADLTPPAVGPAPHCGFGLALSPSLLAVGCRYDAAARPFGGALFVYTRSGSGTATTFGSALRLDPRATVGLRFGDRVAISHELVVASDPQAAAVGADGRGAVWAFDGDAPVLRGYAGVTAAAVGDDRAVRGAAGHTVGHVVLVGAPGADAGGADLGAAWLYRLGHRNGGSCTRDADCLSGHCDGVCGPAPAGARCDWTVTCAAGLSCNAGSCASTTDAGPEPDGGLRMDAGAADAGVEEDAGRMDAAPALDGGADVDVGRDAALTDADADGGEGVDVGAVTPRIPLSCTCRIVGSSAARVPGWSLLALAALGLLARRRLGR